MITAILVLAILTVVLWLAFKCTGLFLPILIWTCFKLSVAVILWGIGLALCCTLILIPIGVPFLRMGSRVLFA